VNQLQCASQEKTSVCSKRLIEGDGFRLKFVHPGATSVVDKERGKWEHQSQAALLPPTLLFKTKLQQLPDARKNPADKWCASCLLLGGPTYTVVVVSLAGERHDHRRLGCDSRALLRQVQR